MPTYDPQEVMDCYNRTAHEYAATFLHELDGKPFDRHILDRFCALLPPGGVIYDMGCGSGQTAMYLSNKGTYRVRGLDFAEAAISLAQQTFPTIEFTVDDMLNSCMDTHSADGIVAFYAIVHFTYTEVEQAFREWQRLLKPNGLALLSFHVGDESIRVDDFLGVHGAAATWQFLDPDRIIAIAEGVGLSLEEAVVRYPYKGKEHPSKRAYILVRSHSDRS